MEFSSPEEAQRAQALTGARRVGWVGRGGALWAGLTASACTTHNIFSFLPARAGSALLQQQVKVVPIDSPSGKRAAGRVLRRAFPPPGLVAMPPPSTPRRHGPRSLTYVRPEQAGVAV